MYELYPAAMMNKRAHKTQMLHERNKHLEILSKLIYDAACAGKFSIKYQVSLRDDRAAYLAIAKLQYWGYEIISNTPEYVEISWHDTK